MTGAGSEKQLQEGEMSHAGAAKPGDLHLADSAEEQQRRPQVTFEDQDGEGDQPGDHQRPEILQSGTFDSEELGADDRE